MNKKLIISLLAISTFLVGCGADATPVKKPEVNVGIPDDCTSAKILAALPSSIPDPKFIDTKWQPAQGTDLFNALNSGGIACSYGNQQAEIGTTIIWAPSDKANFDQMATKWSSLSQIDIPGVNETSAYWSGNEATSADDRHMWLINLLYKNIWIQVNASFVYKMEDALPIINAAIGSLTNG